MGVRSTSLSEKDILSSFSGRNEGCYEAGLYSHIQFDENGNPIPMEFPCQRDESWRDCLSSYLSGDMVPHCKAERDFSIYFFLSHHPLLQFAQSSYTEDTQEDMDALAEGFSNAIEENDAKLDKEEYQRLLEEEARNMWS